MSTLSEPPTQETIKKALEEVQQKKREYYTKFHYYRRLETELLKLLDGNNK